MIAGVVVRGPGRDPSRCSPKKAEIWASEWQGESVRILIHREDDQTIELLVPAIEAVELAADLASISHRILRPKLERSGS